MKSVGLAILLLPLAASAATIVVNSTADNLTAGNGKCTLREAIANVNAAGETTSGDCNGGSGAGDTITFSFKMPAKIRLQLGQLLIQRDVTILSQDAHSVAIDGRSKSRVFEIAAGTTVMSGLTIEHGRADLGGGVRVANAATLNLSRCVIARNRAGSDDEDSLQEGAGGGISNAGTLTLTDCTITGNVAQATLYFSGGGGIHNSGGVVSATNCTLSKNVAKVGGQGGGGAMANDSGVVTVTGGVFVGNRATTIVPWGFAGIHGGAILNLGSMTVTDATLTKNRASVGDDSYCVGGAVSNCSSMTITRCRFVENVAVLHGGGETQGGAIENEGALTVESSYLARNATFAGPPGYSAGAGIFNGGDYCGEDEARVSIANSTIADNVTHLIVRGRSEYGLFFDGGISHGAGVSNEGATVTLTNCSLSGNRARAPVYYGSDTAGAAIFSDGDTTLINCTLRGNAAESRHDYGYGGGGAILSDGSLTLRNTILANSGAGKNCVSEMNAIDGGYNISSDGTCSTVGGHDLLNTKPRLTPLGNFGGPTPMLALCIGERVPHSACRFASPAIDAGDDSVTGPPDNLTTDQRGLPRHINAHVDIGAYEVQ